LDVSYILYMFQKGGILLMEQILNEMVQKILKVVGGDISMDECSHIIKECYDNIMALMPKQMSLESATYSNEASYINGWNACLEKITSI